MNLLGKEQTNSFEAFIPNPTIENYQRNNENLLLTLINDILDLFNVEARYFRVGESLGGFRNFRKEE